MRHHPENDEVVTPQHVNTPEGVGATPRPSEPATVVEQPAADGTRARTESLRFVFNGTAEV